ncbi:MAG: LacI family DNA-binding transcriptional regulator [Lachnospiraceae bacterium]|nr:LacI family DNA-binding transcriptional regulator [Lachnospiraceae bacterium]
MTIKDIAKEAGYSVGTVSRVLNGSEKVSEEAKCKVMEVVEKHHFQLNNNAKLLKQQSSQGIAIIIKGTQNMLFAALLEQMQALIEKHGYASMMFYIEEDDNEVQVACQVCQERRPLGILFLGTNREYFRESFHRITVPCVMVTNSAEGLEIENLSWVTTDDKAAAKVAVEHLFSLGHRNIGVLGGNNEKSYTSFCRFMGAKEAFAEHDIWFDEDRQYVQAYFSISAGYHAMEKLLEKMPEVTAVFAMADVMAIGAIRAICDRGMRVPEDISVIGFDGIDIGRYMMPRLTTIRQHREAIATRSVEVLLGCIGGQMKKVHEIEAFHLVPGESVRAK